MIYTDIEKIEREIVKHYGNAQLDVVVEECAELIQAITKCKRYGCTGKQRENLIEEMADVLVIIDELALIYNVKCSDVYRIMKKKLERQKQRMEVENSENY